MNRIFRLVWNRKQSRYVVASEAASSHKSGSSKLPKAIGLILSVLTSIVNSANAYAVDLNALPTNPVVTQGAATINQNANTLTVNQQTDKLITNWSTFSIGGNAKVQFVQPSATSTALNRVNASDPSYIEGTLSANGKIILINPNGVLFANGAHVDTAGIVASTLKLSDQNFLNDNFVFEKDGVAAAITNSGDLKAFVGGVVALIAPQVINNGNISAEAGDVALLAGSKVTLTLNGNRLIKYSIDQGGLDAMVQNNSVIRAAEGVVILSAKALDTISKSVVNNTGLIEAKGITQSGGRIILDADGGSATNSGTLDVSSPLVIGGSIRVTGDEVAIQSGSNLLATGSQGGGEILVGGSWQNSDSLVRQAINTTVETNATLNASAVNSGNGGQIVVWSAAKDSSSVTNVSGTLIADAGRDGGDGGQIETSGHNLIIGEDVRVSARTNSVDGLSGTWLLDPTDVNITTAVAGVTNISNTCATPAASSNISNSSIVAALNNGTNVTISTGNSGYVPYSGTANVSTSIASGATQYFHPTNLNDGSKVTFSFTSNSSRVKAYYSYDNVTWVDTGLSRAGSITLVENTSNPSSTPLYFKVNSTSSSSRAFTYKWTDASGGTGNISVLSNITYTGVSAAKLTLTAANNINVNNVIASSAGSLDLVLNAGGGVTNNVSGNITTAGGSLNLSVGADSNYSGVLNLGAGSLVKLGTANLTLPNNNTIGSTLVSDGILILNKAQSAGTGNITLNGGDLALISNTNTTFVNNLILNQTSKLYVDASSTSTASITHGIGNISVSQSGIDLGIDNNAVVDTTTYSINLSASNLSLGANGLGLSIGDSNLSLNVTNISGSQSLSLNDIGTLVVRDAGSISGSVLIADGNLKIVGAGALQDAVINITNSSSNFNISAAASGRSIVSLAGSGNVILGANALTLTNAADAVSGVSNANSVVGVWRGATGARYFYVRATISNMNNDIVI